VNHEDLEEERSFRTTETPKTRKKTGLFVTSRSMTMKDMKKTVKDTRDRGVNPVVVRVSVYQW